MPGLLEDLRHCGGMAERIEKIQMFAHDWAKEFRRKMELEYGGDG